MAIFFWILGLFAALFGFSVLGNAKSALHEIEAGIGFLLMAVFWSGAGVMNRLEKLTATLRGQTASQASAPCPSAGAQDEKPST